MTVLAALEEDPGSKPVARPLSRTLRRRARRTTAARQGR